MKTFAFCAPVLKGKRDEFTSLMAQLKGDRRSEAVTSRRAAGVDREQVFLQETPTGDVAVICWDTEDPAPAFSAIASDSSEFGRWFRAMVHDIHGMDISDPTAVPVPELLGEWKDTSWHRGECECTAFCFPVKDVAAGRAFVREIMGARKDEYVSSRRDFGIKRNAFFLMETPAGPIALVYVEGEHGALPRAFKANSTSDEPFLAWWREQVEGFAAVPLFDRGTPPKVTQLLDLEVRVPARA